MRDEGTAWRRTSKQPGVPLVGGHRPLRATKRQVGAVMPVARAGRPPPTNRTSACRREVGDVDQ
eukprot:12556995-Heterocapsa_arctica.AAC.1